MTSPSHHIIIRNWLYINAFMVFAMAIIGAITRLTESGLSITEWKPITGAIPPLTHNDWLYAFDLYKQSPQYQKINTGMSLDDFKHIFFWEWFHRLWGRLIGVVYVVPMLYFWIKDMIPQGYKKPLLGLLILGGMQGVVGWIMVQSGLIDRPSVSHFRLAAHLSLAFIIYTAILWVAFSLSDLKTTPSGFCLRRHGLISFLFLFITLIWGAFMAGTDAGLISDTWPHLYNGQFMPDEIQSLTLDSFFNNQALIHFSHRWIAFIAMIIIATFAWRIKSHALGGMVFIQFGLGIATVIMHVHIHTAAAHQAGAFILGGLLVREIYKITNRVTV